ncbi:MAG: CoB--CoM heterodisulfide reductase iron-sulfur subunit B family protein [Candidatus Thorarchaeota archaeon SMTZ1-83]
MARISKAQKYTYFPGCMIPFRLPHFELTIRKVLERLDVAMIVDESHTCCPEPTTFTGVDFEAWLTIGARNVAVSESTGLDTLALCSGCFHTLAIAGHMLQSDDDVRERVNTRLKKIGMKATGKVAVKNILHVLHEDIGLERIKKRVVRPLKGISIAAHYGCHLVRPLEATHMDDAENPRWMEDLVEAVGANAIEYEDKMACCGAPIGPSDESKSFRLTAEKLRKIRAAGADAIVMICPTCYTQMEMQQKKAVDYFDPEFSIPVLYLGEMLALAMGMTDLVTSNSRRYHRVKIQPILEKMGVGK